MVIGSWCFEHLLTFDSIQLMLERPAFCQAMRNTEIYIIGKVCFPKDPRERVVFFLPSMSENKPATISRDETYGRNLLARI